MARNRRTTDRGDLVRRAARSAGQSRTAGRQSSLRFLALVAMIVVAGSTMVGFAWASRQYNHPTLFDSWQSAYGVYSCDTTEWLPPIESDNNPNGIRTRGDGVIYIEPTVDSATGNGARLDVFLDNVGAELNEESLVLPDGTTISEAGTFCSGEEAVLQVQRWSSIADSEPAEIRYDNFDSMPFLNDGEAFVVALAPVGATITLPPSADLLPEPGVLEPVAVSNDVES